MVFFEKTEIDCRQNGAKNAATIFITKVSDLNNKFNEKIMQMNTIQDGKEDLINKLIDRINNVDKSKISKDDMEKILLIISACRDILHEDKRISQLTKEIGNISNFRIETSIKELSNPSIKCETYDIWQLLK